MIVGLTGGFGAGKSAVADLFSGRGATIIDTDVIAREIVTPPSAVLDALVAEFGAGIVRTDGALDRKALASLVFGNAAREARLNEITHPEIRARTLDAMFAQPASALVVVVVPLLLQTGFDAYCDKVVSVVASRDVRLQRVMQRDGISKAEAEARMAAQLSDSEYERRADIVIRNDGDIALLTRAVDDALMVLRAAQNFPDASN